MRELASLARYLIEVFPDQYKYYSAARIHLEQHPAAQPKSAAWQLSGRGRCQDRIHQRIRLRHDRICHAGRPAIYRRGGRLKSPREREEEVTRLLDYGFSQFRPVRTVLGRRTVGAGAGLGWRRPRCGWLRRRTFYIDVGSEQATAEGNSSIPGRWLRQSRPALKSAR